MSRLAQQFIAGAFGLIALFLALSHFTGVDNILGALGRNSSTVFKTLQGR